MSHPLKEGAVNQLERFHKIEDLLRNRAVVPKEDFLSELEVSLATFKRDLQAMRDRLNAPIEYDADNGGYRFAQKPNVGPRYELPGLWFNASEVHALLTMQELLKGLEPGILAPHVEPLRTRLNALLERDDSTVQEIARRIRIITMAARVMKLEFFELAATATLKRQRIDMTFWSRHSNQTTERQVSPQRLVFYRNNWYLDAWCHLRNAIRSFAVDGIRKASLLADKAKNVPEGELDDYLASAYGIFAGRAKGWAKLRFSPTAARWVAHEKWHSRQRGRYESDGSYLLEVPYGDDRELLMDILKYGPDCRVLEPKELVARVSDQARKTAALYG